MSHWRSPPAMAVVLCLFGAVDAARAEPGCSGNVNRENVVPCALAASLATRVEQGELAAAEGRRVAASPLLPSNPTLAFSAGRRTGTAGASAVNWSASLSQELEIGGQRGARRGAAEAEVRAQETRVALARRLTAARAWLAYFEALAAEEERRLAVRLQETTTQVAVVARARADKGLAAPIDADVADAVALRALQDRFAAERRVAESGAALLSLLGRDPSTPVVSLMEGELVPLSVSGTERPAEASLAARPELTVFESERRAQDARASAFRRARVPNPTLSVFVQNDGFDEKVLGAGIALPIPLPGNVGRTNIGEIAEAEALSHRAAVERALAERELRTEWVTAARDYESRLQEVRAFSPERLAQADLSLGSIGEEVQGGRLAVRDAVVMQRALIEMLQSAVSARRALCVSSVVLARAAGVPLERGAR